METYQLPADWEKKKEVIKREYPEVTDEDLVYQIGKDEEVLERLSNKMKKTKKEIFDWLHIMG